MMFIEFIQSLLPFLTWVSDILIIAIILIFIIQRIILKKRLFISRVFTSLTKRYGLLFAFLFASTATFGSLFYSEVLGWDPCKLCWYQRIFMYPQALILLFAAINKEKRIANYIIPLSIIGGLIAAYHYFIQFSSKIVSCGSLHEIDCSVMYTFDFGYITIPMMALTAFILTAYFTYYYKKLN
jgi:disulfide bond formation protein DsbB